MLPTFRCWFVSSASSELLDSLRRTFKGFLFINSTTREVRPVHFDEGREYRHNTVVVVLGKQLNEELVNEMLENVYLLREGLGTYERARERESE